MGNPTLLTMPLCQNADKNTIPPTDAGTSGLFSEELGFQDINSLPLASGGKAPNRRDFNGVFALLGGIAYACQRGQTFEWVNNLPYLAGCVVTDPLDGKKYNAKNDVAEGGTNPSLDPTNWEIASGGDSTPIGTMINFAGNGTLPDSYLVCDGSAISRTTYAELFDVIGTTYGVGDGTTTFNLPDLTDATITKTFSSNTNIDVHAPMVAGNTYTSGGVVTSTAYKGESIYNYQAFIYHLPNQDGLYYDSNDNLITTGQGTINSTGQGCTFYADLSRAISEMSQGSQVATRVLIKYE